MSAGMIPVPIPTVPGLVSAHVGADAAVVPIGRLGRVARVWLQRTDHQAGDVVQASLRNAAAGAGDGIDVTLGDGIAGVSVAGSLAVTDDVYLHVTASDGNSANLSGYLEFVPDVPGTSVLVPIATLPGLAQGWLGQDVPVAQVPGRVTQVFLHRTDDQAGDVVQVSLRNAPGGGGEGIDLTLGDGQGFAVVVGDLSVAGLLYLRVTAADANSANLAGYVEVEDALQAPTTFLTNLARVKAYLGDTSTQNDVLLNTLVAAVSRLMQQWMRRRIVRQSVVDERIDVPGGTDTIRLEHYPVVLVESVDELGTALAAADYHLEADSGMLVRLDADGQPAAWRSGTWAVRASYDAGYITVPDDLAHAATRDVVHAFRQTQAGGGRGGLQSAGVDGQGAATFVREGLLVSTLDAMAPYRRWRV